MTTRQLNADKRWVPRNRLLCGPGPSNVSPTVQASLGHPMLGHLDPDYHELLLELAERLRRIFRASPDAFVFTLQASGTSGMETGIANLVEPGDTVIVGIAGFFGERMAEIASRHGAEVVRVEAPWGEVVPNEALLSALDAHPDTRLIGVVHAETSTGAQHPVAELGGALRESDAFLLVDCVTSLGGVPLEVEAWGIDYAYSCTQKCLGGPPGLSPIAVSERAMDRIRARTTPIPFSFDLELLYDYWVTRPALYHHTAPILQVYALYEAILAVEREGLEARWERHEKAGAHLQRTLEERGLELLADSRHRLAPLSAVCVPDGIDGKEVQTRMLREHGIEIGGSLGSSPRPIWRIGLMGYNARVEIADRVCAALDESLAGTPAPTAPRAA